MKNELINQLEQRKHQRTKSVAKNYPSGLDEQPRMNNSNSISNLMKQRGDAEDMYSPKPNNSRSMMASYALAKPQSYNVRPQPHLDETDRSGFETVKYDRERKLIENDPFLLEEHRYLDRLKNMELRQNQKVEEHYQKYTLPDIARKQHQEGVDDINTKKRQMTKAKYQQYQREMKDVIGKLNQEAIRKQMASQEKRRKLNVINKYGGNKQMEMRLLDSYNASPPPGSRDGLQMRTLDYSSQPLDRVRATP
jgi:hypothetical protein